MSILDDEDILVSQTREAASIDSRIIENAKKYFSDEITGHFVTLFISDEELKNDLILFKSIINRPIYSIDCKTLCKNDAIGFLEFMSKQSDLVRPIVLIENITEIPDEDSVHDNPEYVKNILIHSWKNPINDFYNPISKNHFHIKSDDFVVLLTAPSVPQKNTLETVWRASDGFAFGGDYVNDKKEYILVNLEIDKTLEQNIKSIYPNYFAEEILLLYKHRIDCFDWTCIVK